MCANSKLHVIFQHWIKYACWFFLWLIKKERNTAQKILFILTPCVHFSRLVYNNGIFTGLKKKSNHNTKMVEHITPAHSLPSCQRIEIKISLPV